MYLHLSMHTYILRVWINGIQPQESRYRVSGIAVPENWNGGAIWAGFFTGRLVVTESEEPVVPEEVVEPTEPATDPNNPSESTGPSEPDESEVSEGLEGTVSTDNSKSDETNIQ